LEPALYIVATPIGNLADISRRAIEVLGAADLVAAEDTRHTGQLLSSLAIRARLLAYHEHSAPVVGERLRDAVAAGQCVALVSDAGTPTISDPGYRLVRTVQEAGLPVIPVPGACALIAALSASGLPSDRFSFGGFLPARGEARRQRLAQAARAPETQLFYEAPHRIRDTLHDLVSICGPQREAGIARELTKRFETIRRAPLGELLAWVDTDSNQERGEIVLMLAPDTAAAPTLDDAALLRLLVDLAEVVPARQAAKLLARHCTHSARELYGALLQARGQGEVDGQQR
jgi:16S rRNA (cytidine1402-2'-O)-methyltransferase